MENSIIIIDNEPNDWRAIAKILKQSYSSINFYPKKESYDTFLEKIEKGVSDNFSKSSINSIADVLIEQNINPILFIIDISLTENPTNESGLELGKVLKTKYNEIPIIYITSFRRNQLGVNVPLEEDLVYKNNLEILVGKIMQKLPDEFFAQPTSQSVNHEKIDIRREPEQNESIKINVEKELQNKIAKDDAILSAKRLLKIHEQKRKKIKEIDTPNYPIHKMIDLFFIIIIISSTFFLLYYSLGHILFDYKKDTFPFTVIEYLFLSPLPLIITFTFYNYYNKILRPVLFKDTANTDAEKATSLLDINISKYLFISILFSTMLVVVIEFFKKSTETSSFKSDIELSKAMQIDSIKNLPDSYPLINLKGLTLGDLKNYEDSSFKNEHLALYAFIAGAVVLILLVIYLFKLEKTIGEKRNIRDET